LSEQAVIATTATTEVRRQARIVAPVELRVRRDESRRAA
jgi:hypothetical protein